MIHQGEQNLVKLEWRRLRQTAIALAIGYSGLILVAVLITQFADAFVAAKIVFPSLAGLLMGAGMVADDTQQRTLSNIFSLPISRARLWVIRVGARMIVLFAFFIFWVLLPKIFGLDLTPPQSGSIPSNLFLIITGLLSFSMALLTTNLTNNSFEAALSSWILIPLIMIIVRTNQQSDYSLSLYFVALVITTGAAFHIFVTKEPPAGRALWKQTFLWMISLMAVLYLGAGLMG